MTDDRADRRRTTMLQNDIHSLQVLAHTVVLALLSSCQSGHLFPLLAGSSQ